MTRNAAAFHTRVGELEVSLVGDGAGFFHPLHPTFGTDVPADLFAREAARCHVPADGYCPIHAVLVRGRRRCVLIDAGSGGSFGPESGTLPRNLAKLGVRPADVTDVLLTHLHPDHAGGLTDAAGELAFPDAAVHVAEAEADFWRGRPALARSAMSDDRKRRFVESAGVALDAVDDRLQMLGGGREAVGGITPVPAPGHTPGHVGFRIADNGASLLFLGDAIFFPPLLTRHPGWHTTLDTDPAAGAATRLRLFDELATTGERLCATHLPLPAVGHLDRAGGGYEYLPEHWR